MTDTETTVSVDDRGRVVDEPVFDPTKVDTTSDNIRLEWGTWITKDVHDIVTNHFGFYLTWIRDFNKSADHEDNLRPAWADSQVKDRVWREIEPSLARSMTYLNLSRHKELNLHVDLPCPPYGYEIDGTRLVISSGPYKKAGTKEEFEGFITELQEELEQVPEGEDISDMYLRASGTVTVTFNVNIPVKDILDGDEELDGDTWMGDMDTMQERASEVFEENTNDYIEMDDVDMSYGFDDVYVNESYVD